MVAALVAAAALAAHAPVVVHDAREATPVSGVRSDAGASVVYGRVAGDWLQYWLWFADNPQDRGVLRTGRHEGDWELVQVRVDGSQAVFSQHSSAERCGRDELRFEGSRLVVFAAHGSHALYPVAGLRDRMWPDPNDEARGDGERVRPRVVEVSESSPQWMSFSGRWGASRARWWVPGESDSPRGPAFQGVRWDDPEAFARSASSCRAERCNARGECDGGESALAVGAALAALSAGAWVRRRRRGNPASRGRPPASAG